MKYNGIILGTKISRPTARLIAEKFHAIYTEMPGIFWSGIEDIKYVFRYGNCLTQIPNFFAGGKMLFNTVRAVRLMSHKLECRQWLLQGSVPCPRLFFLEDVNDFTDMNFPKMIARPDHHFQGRNFNIVSTKKEAIHFLEMGYYLQEIIEKRIEYRMFMFNTHIMETDEKVMICSSADPLVRNHRRGWKFEKRSLEDINLATRASCKKAATSVGADWCAIDVCENEAGRPFILEVNSSPGLIERKVIKLHNRFFQEYPNFLIHQPNCRNERTFFNDD